MRIPEEVKDMCAVCVIALVLAFLQTLMEGI